MSKRINNEAINIAMIYRKWLDECECRRSEHTVRAYNITMKVFMEFLESTRNLSVKSFCSAECFTFDVLTEWVGWMNKVKRLKPVTCNARLASLRSFLKYLGQKELKYKAFYMDSLNVLRLREPRIKVSGMSEKSVKMIIDEANTNKKTGFRDAVLISFLYSTATRLDETLSVRICDLRLDAERPNVLVRGKGNKYRVIILPDKLVKNLRKYISIFHSTSKPEDILFFSRVKGKQGKLSQTAVGKRLKMYAQAAHQKDTSVPDKVHAHKFRHAQATHLLKDGMNIAQVSKYLGHEQLSTTMIYLDVDMDMKTDAILKLEDDRIKDIKPKWNKDNFSLTDLFK